MRLCSPSRLLAIVALLGVLFTVAPGDLYSAEPATGDPPVTVVDTAPAPPDVAVPATADTPAINIDLGSAIDGAWQGIQNTPEGAPWWAYLIYGAIGIVMAIFGAGYLQTKAADLKRQAALAGDDIKRRAWLSLQAYALERADARLQKDGWAIAREVQNGDLNEVSEIKARLYAMGAEEKTELIEYFKAQFPEIAGGNLIEAFGEKYIDQLIEWAANRVWSQIPEFAGKSTAETLLKGGAKRLLTYGITHAIDFGVGKIEGVLTPTEPVEPEG